MFGRKREVGGRKNNQGGKKGGQTVNHRKRQGKNGRKRTKPLRSKKPVAVMLHAAMQAREGKKFYMTNGIAPRRNKRTKTLRGGGKGAKKSFPMEEMGGCAPALQENKKRNKTGERKKKN